MEWLLTDWKLAMLGLLAFLLLHRVKGRWPVHKLRTWAALFGTSVAGAVLTPEHGTTPFLAYVLICAVGGWIVLIKPAGTAQKAIGFLFVIMLLIHGGVAAGGAPYGPPPYLQVIRLAGVVQLLILLWWSLWDAGVVHLVGNGLAKVADRFRRSLRGKGAASAHRERAQ